jgi:hypothetical protein
MKARIITYASVLVSLLALSSAKAAPVTMKSIACTGIQGIEINIESYNVHFDTVCAGPDIDGASPDQSITAIDEQVSGYGSNLNYVQDRGATNNALLIQSIGHSIYHMAGANRQDSEQRPEAWLSYLYTPTNFYENNPALSANFIKLSASIPDVAIIFGSSLVLIGSVRRRFDQ